ncbi:MAG: hypothetical protein ROO76_06530 [Terriglobia bacterium]|jgi:hypothetical protein|nr:hypothetical protein [Terriglobia bacterium]
MKRFFVLPIVLLTCAAAFAQTPGPESTSNNQNQPSVNLPKTTPPVQAPESKSAPSATPNDGATPGISAEVPAQNSSQPPQPTTEILPQGNSTGSADPLLEPKELPKKELSLIGGIATKVDPIRNRVQVKPFGSGKKLDVRFDERSHVYRDGRETTVMGIHKGDRVYLDTMLLDGHVFAKNLRVMTSTQAAEARGQLTGVYPNRNEYTMIDSLTGQSLRFQVTPRTTLQDRGQLATAASLKPGAIVDVIFLPGQKGGTARQVLVLAVPGQTFIFSGKVTYLDLSTGTLSLDNQTDDKNYTLHFNPAAVSDREHLTVGREVTASATFDGQNYRATTVTLMSLSSAQQ